MTRTRRGRRPTSAAAPRSRRSSARARARARRGRRRCACRSRASGDGIQSTGGGDIGHGRIMPERRYAHPPMLAPVVLLALLVAAPIAVPPTSNAIGAVPDEPGAFVLPDAPILQTVVADIDGDGRRELVRLIRGDGDAALAEVWVEKGPSWGLLGEPVEVVPPSRGRDADRPGLPGHSGAAARAARQRRGARDGRQPAPLRGDRRRRAVLPAPARPRRRAGRRRSLRRGRRGQRLRRRGSRHRPRRGRHG